MTTFLAIYSGDTVSNARMIVVTADPELLSGVAATLLNSIHTSGIDVDDSAVGALERGRYAALRIIAGCAGEQSD